MNALDRLNETFEEWKEGPAPKGLFGIVLSLVKIIVFFVFGLLIVWGKILMFLTTAVVLISLGFGSLSDPRMSPTVILWLMIAGAYYGFKIYRKLAK